MAYQIGRLLARHFSYELIDVAVYSLEEHGKEIFKYDTKMRLMAVADMEKNITPDDVLVVNPAFSHFLFGLRLPGKKIMYIQDFRTFLLLDCHFDLYVSVSNLVARYVHALYGITTAIIPPFITPPAAPTIPWQQRPAGSSIVYIKNPSREHHILLQFLQRRLAKTAPLIDLSHVVEGRRMAQEDFLRELGNVRYLVNLSLAEGFGLVPLEAMAIGTMVSGVDGLAGADYIRQGHNALVGSIRDLRPLPAIVQRAFEDDNLAQQCVEGGFRTASLYNENRFKEAWLRELSQLLRRDPDI